MPLRNTCLILAMLFTSSSGLAASEYARPELLIEPNQLADGDPAKHLVILDARDQHEYKRGHVPGALWVDHAAWKKAFGDGKDAEAWSKRIGELGIREDSTVAAYDDLSSKNAARIWWLLQYWGVDGAKLLNGGWKAWTAAGLPTSMNAPAPRQSDFAVEPRSRLLATKPQILESLPAKRLQIIDSRSAEEHCGKEMRDNRRGGAIPGAIHLEWKDLLDPDTDRFRSAGELKRLFARAGIDLTRPTATHCQSGGRAAVMVFAMKLMGANDVGNYYFGWSEWGNDETLPLVVPQ